MLIEPTETETKPSLDHLRVNDELRSLLGTGFVDSDLNVNYRERSGDIARGRLRPGRQHEALPERGQGQP